MRYRFSGFEVDEERFELRRWDEPVPIQAKPLRLLIELLAQHPQTSSRERLLQKVWPDEKVTPASLNRAVAIVRRTLGASSDAVIETVRGYGYRIAAPVTRLVPQTARGEGFVGRSREIETLCRTLEAALEGEGSLVLVSGEPGIGKTRMARELATIAGRRGARVVWAMGEERAAAHGYWIQILRSLVFEGDAETIQGAMGTWAWDLRVLLPEIEPALSAGAAPVALDPEFSRLRLFDSVMRLLRLAAESRGLVLVLDDLHWADAASLDLLRFVARQVEDARLLLLALYRDVAAPPHPALQEAMGDLARGGASPELRLRGLSVEEVGELLASLSEHASSDEAMRKWSQEVWERTQGNPFFVREVAIQGGAGVGADSPSAGVGGAVRERLRWLGQETLDCLTTAALAGPHVSPPLLARVCGTDAEGVLAHLERAESEGLLLRETRGSRAGFSFAHDLVRETLAAAIDPAQRRQLHLAIGEGLEALHGSQPERYAAALAEHLIAALPLGDAERAERYASAAARQSRERLAFGDAAHHLEGALRAHEARGDATPAQRCDLLLELAEAQQLATDPAATETAREAAALARVLDDSERLARAALALATRTPRIMHSAETLAALEEAVAALPAGPSARRVRLYAALAREREYSNESDLADAALACAQREAALLGDPALDAEAALEELLALQHRQVEHRESARAADLLERGLALGRPDLVLSARRYRIACEMERGVRASLDREVDDFEREAEDSRLGFARHLAAAFRAMQASLDGREVDAERWIERCRTRADPRSPHDALFTPVTLEGLLSFDPERGRRFLRSAEEILRLIPTPNWRIGRAWMQSRLGLRDEAREELAAFAARGYLQGVPGSAQLMLGTALAEIAAGAGSAADCEALYAILEAQRELVVTNGYGISCFGPVAHYLGLLAGALGRLDEAARDFEVAISAAGRLGSRRWETESRLAYASLLIDASDPGRRERAAGLVRLASEACEQMDTTGLSARAAELRDALA